MPFQSKSQQIFGVNRETNSQIYTEMQRPKNSQDNNNEEQTGMT